MPRTVCAIDCRMDNMNDKRLAALANFAEHDSARSDAAGITVVAAADAYADAACQLAKRLDVPVVQNLADAAEASLALVVDERGLTLVGDGMELRADLTRMLPRLRPGAIQKELLVKAAKIKGVANPVAVDATAGFGEDSLLLAAAGFTVRMFESDPVIAALARDGLRRARLDPKLAGIASRMELLEGDSIVQLPKLPFQPDVVLLDPMFPERTKSASVKKKFQLLHRLERPCSNEEALLQAAFACNPRKVVVKRPVKGPYLAGVKPSHSIAGKAVRYDCLIPPAQQ